MPLLDALAVLAVLLVAFSGGAGIRMAWDRRSAEARGERNARIDTCTRKCHFCNKPVDPDVDHFVDPYWYHSNCKGNDNGH